MATAGHILPTSSTTTMATRSTCTPVINHGSHVFDIFGFSLHRSRDRDFSITSGTFTVGGHDWKIRFFPNYPVYTASDDDGGGGAVQQCISIHVALVSKGAKVRASCDLGLVDHTTGLPVSVHRTPEPWREFRYSDGSMFFPPPSSSLIDLAGLESSVYLQNDRLTVHCHIAVVKEPRVFAGDGMFVGKLDPPPPNITEHLGKLLESGEGADVTFAVDGETFAAHKMMLAARSPVFRAELCGGGGAMTMMEAQTRRVTVHDVQPDVFRALLHFIYTDALPDHRTGTDDEDGDGTCWGHADNRMIQHLLVAANRYDVERLKLVCEGLLCDSLDPGNLASTLALAYHYNCPKLKNVCFYHISDPNVMEAVKATTDYADLRTNYPYILADALEFITSNMRKKTKTVSGSS